MDFHADSQAELFPLLIGPQVSIIAATPVETQKEQAEEAVQDAREAKVGRRGRGRPPQVIGPVIWEASTACSVLWEPGRVGENGISLLLPMEMSDHNSLLSYRTQERE